MKNKFVAVLICLLFNAVCFSQTKKENGFSFGSGFVQTMNTASLYSGLRGINTSFDYQYFKQAKKYEKSFWSIFADLDFDFLLTNEPPYMRGTYPNFYRGELSFGSAWFWQLPCFLKNLNLYAGAGLSFNSEINFSANNQEDNYSYIRAYNFPDLNWFFSPDLQIRAEYNLKKLSFKSEFVLPAAMVGNYFNQFHYLPVSMSENTIAKYKFTPNTFTFLHKIFRPTIKLSAEFPLKKSYSNAKQWYFQIKYMFENTDVKLKYYREKKEQHSIRLGFVCKM
ncbi:MAG: hypothetical protein LBB53_07135 [Prevotellaceae bacterium]|jgi:hypothetical protein|nr:hypothetical protein [Prevotellaceae bacterium]